MLDIRVLTIFPRIFDSFLSHGNPARAKEMGLLRVETVDLRDFTEDRHRSTDDYPYGGGRGMIMKPEPIVKGLRMVISLMKNPRVILMTPQGRLFNQRVAEELITMDGILIVCGRYEGVDERVRCYVHDEISVGDYILSGGETAAAIMIDALVRLVPGVIEADSHIEGESFYDGLLEYPQYTRPRVFEGHPVPWVLLDGHHEKIRRWRKKQALARTLARRPDLLQCRVLEAEENQILEEISSEANYGSTENNHECA
jgi:tRNA (guanine37-N1)-methyltransferase